MEKKKVAQVPAVQLVCEWSLHTAAILVGSVALSTIALKQYHITTTPSWLSDAKLTAAAAAEETAIWHRGLWCSAAQAAAAALGLLLPERRRMTRRALAYAALAAAATAHLMLRVVALFLTADPGDFAWWIAGAGTVAVFATGTVLLFDSPLSPLQ